MLFACCCCFAVAVFCCFLSCLAKNTKTTRKIYCDLITISIIFNFSFRNLSVKVQLVEFRNDVVWSSYPTLLNSPHTVLPSVYNTSYITGPVFVNEAYSRVSYHQKNPAVNDEVNFLFFV